MSGEDFPKANGSIELLEIKRVREQESTPDLDSEHELLKGESSGDESKAKSEKNGGLKREINVVHGVAYIVGQMIGSGIFITPSIILCLSGSFGVTMILWAVGAVIALCGSMCYIELGITIRKSGGEYAYLYEAYSFNGRRKWTSLMGSLIAFLFSWVYVFLVRPGSVAVILLTCASYLVQSLYIGCKAPTYIITLVALVAIMILTIVNSYSVKLAARLTTVVSLLKIMACVFVIAVGIAFIAIHRRFPEDLHTPFDSFANDPTASSIALALYNVLWAYEGWNVLNYAVEETKRPERTLPLSVLIGVPIVAVCYLLVNVAFFSVLTYTEIISSNTVGLSFGKAALGLIPGLVSISLLVAVSTFGTANGSLFSGSRIAFATARDGLLPDAFSSIHQSFKTPLPSVILTGIISAIYICIGDIQILINGISAAAWVFYLLVFLSVPILRITQPKLSRPFKAWVIIPIAVFMILVSAFLVVLPLITKPVPSAIAFVIILLGVPVYVFLVMEQPRKFRPRFLDTLTNGATKRMNSLLNTASSRDN